MIRKTTKKERKENVQMAAKKRKKHVPPEVKEWVKRERASGRMPFFDKSGDAASVRMKRGATKGHKSCRG